MDNHVVSISIAEDIVIDEDISFGFFEYEKGP